MSNGNPKPQNNLKVKNPLWKEVVISKELFHAKVINLLSKQTEEK